MSITRYDPEPDADACSRMAVVPLGDYVSYSDHAAAIAEARHVAELAKSDELLRAAVARAEKAEKTLRLWREAYAMHLKQRPAIAQAIKKRASVDSRFLSGRTQP